MRKLLFSPAFSFREAALLFVEALVIMLLWAQCITFVVELANGAQVAKHSMYYYAPYSLFVPPIALQLVFEEAFRLVPLASVVWIVGRFARLRPYGDRIIGTASAVTAVAFGLMHLPNGLPLAIVLCCQTVLGFALNVIYLRTGGMHGRIVRAFWFAYAMHLSYDILLAVIEKTFT
ncbi:MAG: hypothetical protein RLZZ324_1273 [Candidatus Parcubacteria bacterium]|jgi:membrane protease YdiL (CAAX protease family)